MFLRLFAVVHFLKARGNLFQRHHLDQKVRNWGFVQGLIADIFFGGGRQMKQSHNDHISKVIVRHS